MSKVTDQGLLQVYEMGRQSAIHDILDHTDHEVFKQIEEDGGLSLTEQTYLQAIMEIVTAHLAVATTEILGSAIDKLNQPGFTDTLGPQFQQHIWDKEDQIRGYVGDRYNEGKTSAFMNLKRPFYEGASDLHMRRIVQDYNMSLIKNISDDLRSEIGRTIREGIQNGDSVPQIAGRVEKLGIQPIRAGGRMLKPAERATLIARTETIRANAQGTLISYQEYGVEYVDFVTAGDSHVCPDCIMAAQNGPYPINHIPITAIIPRHPACGCVYAAHYDDQLPKQPTDPSTVMDLTTNKMRNIGGEKAEVTVQSKNVLDVDVEPRNYTVYDFKDDDLQVNVPVKFNGKRQLLRVEDVLDEYKKMPKIMRDQVRTITLSDTYSLREIVRPLKYAHVAASYLRSTRNVNVYRNDYMKAHGAAKVDLADILHHEFAHGVDYAVGEKFPTPQGLKKLSYTKRSETTVASSFEYNGQNVMPWDMAMRSDGGPYGGRFVSEYGQAHYNAKGEFSEDFADSVKLYMKNPASFKKDYPQRGKIIETFLGVT